MRRSLGWVVVSVALVAAPACSSSSTSRGSEATGGAAGSAAALGGGGGGGGATTVGSAGTVSAIGGTGGGSGVSAGAGGSVPVTDGGASGAATNSDGGMTNAAGAGGDANRPRVPSEGCGNMNPETGGRTIMTGGETANFNVHIPDDYDPMVPLPLGFGFHGFGNGACGPDEGECRGLQELPAVTVYMKSISAGWEQNEVRERNITYFQEVLELMKSEFCIDESRVFVAGVSSGGQFVQHLTCRFGDTFWQVTPVSAGVVRVEDCVGTPPVLVIHGITDGAGDYGEGVAALFAERNGCSSAQPDGLDEVKDQLMAAFDAGEAEHVCLDWDDCTKNPLRFCLSSQITYNGLTHGWPRIGGELIGDFQSTLE